MSDDRNGFITDQAVDAAARMIWRSPDEYDLDDALAAIAAALPHIEPLIRADQRRRIANDLDRHGQWKAAAAVRRDKWATFEEATDGR